MDNAQNPAPVIPAGTEKMYNAVYNPLNAANNGQATTAPNIDQSQSLQQQAVESGLGKAPQGTTFDELAVKKGFKSADDLATAYANLESQNKRVEMSLAELAKLREQSQSSEVRPEELNQVQSQEDALKVVERVVRRHTRPLEDKLALTELFYKNPDAQQYAVEMAKIVKDNPGVNWDVAYRAAKFEQLGKQAQEKGRQEAYQVIQQKERVTAESARASVKDSRSLADIVKDKNIPFVEVQRIMKEKFAQS